MRALAITGPRSHPKHIDAFRRSANAEWTLCESPDAEALEKDLQAQDVAVIFGGDGTLHRHLSVLVEAQVPVLMVPTGSGNDFALACGICSAQDSLALFQQAAQNKIRASFSDLGKAELGDGTSHLFACCLDVGLDADAARRTNKLPNWLKSSGGYFLGGVGAVMAYEAKHFRVELQEEVHDPAVHDPAVHEEDMWFASVTNTPTFGGGLPIAPGGRIDDGLLECTLVRKTSRLELIMRYPSILRGRHVGMSMVMQRRATKVLMQSDDSMPVYADGECLGCLPATI